MANSTLHLVVDKGPKLGETLDRKAGAVIRVGRVARGNTFPIKDPGISQKHLTIEFVSEISKWTVKDLDTSNGTIVNDTKIPPLTPFPLSDGDTIKVGESTSICVTIDGDGEVDGALRRGSRRAARSRAESSDKGGIERNVEVAVEEPRNLGRGRLRKGDSSKVQKKDEALDSIEAKPRRAGLRARATSARNSKEEGPREADSMLSKKNELLDSVVVDSTEAPKKKMGRSKKALARTRASSAGELRQCDSLAEEVSEIRGLNVENNAVEKIKDVAVEEEIIVDFEMIAEKNKDVESGRKEKGKMAEEDTIVDLEKMTLGQWFDSMEKYLPQAIHDVAERLTADLREKARRFDEYVMNAVNDG